MDLKRISVIGLCLAAVAAVVMLVAFMLEPPKIYISEICPSNSGTSKKTDMQDKNGDPSDWIEIYNPTNKDISLSEFSLSKNGGADQPLGGYVVKAHDYIIVYCSSAGFENADFPHVDFNIGKVSEAEIILRYNSLECESIKLPKLDKGVSYSKNADGTMYVSEPTPLAANAEKTIGDTPVFSKAAGSYKKAFDLEITAGEGQTVYYTTDGTDPATSDTRKVYKKALKIYDRSDDENVVSAYDPMKIQLDYRDSIKLPDKSVVDKGTVIRACAEGTSGKCGRTVTATYFVGVSSEDHNGLPIISLTTDPDGLFNEKTGIYSLGEVYEEYDEENPDHPWNGSIPANYNQRGREWEKECYVEYFDSEGNSLISQDCGVRIQGGWSRADYQKSFRFYARGDYGKSSFDTAFWDNYTDINGVSIDSCKTFVLRNGGNDANYSKFKDTMIQSMVSGRGVETQTGTACVLFIDGEYWGLYTLQSDYSDRYFADKYGVAKSNVVVYKNDELSEGETEDKKLFEDMYKFITENDMSDEKNYKKACAMIDMDNLADYSAAELYIFNDDWPQNNYACWRTRTIEQGNSYADGRWRFMLFDTESSGDHYNEKYLNRNMFSYLKSKSETKLGGILCSLIKNKGFSLKLTSAACQYGSVNFTPERFGEYLESYKDIYYGELDNYFRRFPTWANRKKATDPMLARWQNFIDGRYERVLTYLAGEFGLYDQRTVKISVADSEQGGVLIGGVELESGYSGTYFDGCEIKMTAQAKAGWHFDHWEGVAKSDADSQSVTVTVDGDMAVTAVFEKDVV